MLEKKFTIKLSTAGGGKPFLRQLPNLTPIWKDCEFYINEDIPECDLWVVQGGLGKVEQTKCPPDMTLFITNEPPSVKKFSKKFTQQFDYVLTCPGTTKSGNTIYGQQALPWWVGHKVGSTSTTYDKTYDQLTALQPTPKTKLLSIIASNKQFTKGHKLRYNFAQYIKKELGDDVDVFGMGENSVEDKWDAIAPYKYHIVIENGSYDHYWSEKLADSFLAQSYPLYYGAPNIHEYFTKDMLTAIDITDPKKALQTIKEVIANDTYEKSVTDLAQAKDLILNTYQLFPMLYTYLHEHLQNEAKTLITLAPERQSGIVPYMKKCVKALLRIIHAR